MKTPMPRYVHVLACTLVFATAFTMAGNVDAKESKRRPFQPADVHRINEVGDVALSPDGGWVAYSVGTTNVEKDTKSFNADQGRALLGALDSKIDALQQRWFEAQKAKATTHLDAMKGYNGVALRLPPFQARHDAMDADFARVPPDFDAIKRAVDALAAGDRQLKKISDDFRVRHAEVTALINSYGRDRLTEISDPLVKPEHDAIAARIALAAEKLEQHKDILAAQMATAIYWEVEAATKILAERNDYLPLKTAATQAFAQLGAALNPGADAEYPLIRADIERAAAQEATRDFYSASLIAKGIPARIAPLLTICQQYDAFETALIAANTAVDRLKDHHLAEYIPADILEIETLVKASVDLAAGGDYTTATARLETVPKRCSDAEVEAERARPFADLIKTSESGDLDTLIAAAGDRLAALRSHPRADLVKDTLDTLADTVDTAATHRDDGRESEARAALTRAAELAAADFSLLQAVDQIHNRADRLTAETRAVESGHAQGGYVQGRLDAILDLADRARALVVKAEEGTLELLIDGEAKLVAAKRLADAQAAYLARRKEVSDKADALATLDYPDKGIVGPAIAADLDAAANSAKAFDHVKAEGALKKAEQKVALAHLARKTTAAEAITADDVNALLALPDGDRLLDKMVADLPDDISQKAMAQLLSARFDMNVSMFADKDGRAQGTSLSIDGLGTVPGPKLKAYYDMLASVPPSHAKLNPSLAKFDQIQDSSGSYYQSQQGAVVMACYNHFDVQTGALAAPAQLGEVEEACQPDTSTPMPSYGKWTTLHEIGHAVDDRKGFMKSKGSTAAFGGWRDHGSDVSQISAEVAAEFGFDVHYVESKMAGGTPAMPDPPDGTSANDWINAHGRFTEWLAAVRHGQQIWDSALNSAKYKMRSGRMIHEAYANHWVSYDFDARKQGITGYQFRAPGEWFSELYAAYFTRKLKPSHPAQKWLSAL